MTRSTTTFMSKKGMKELKKSIQKLEHQRKQVILELRELDKGENHDLRLSRVEKLAQLENIETDLADKTLLASTAKLFPRKRDALRVALGSAVELIDSQGRLVRYTLVDSIEANPSDGRISANSPLGQSLLGKTIKDTIEWGVRTTTMQMQLVAIR